MRDDGHTVVTPEAVPLHLETATAGSRMLAGMVDVIVIGIVLLGGAFAFGLFGDLTPVGVWIVASAFGLFATSGYFLLLEALWDGRTVGKRALGLRVVTTEGGPAPTSAVVARNLVRIVDLLPGVPLVGVVTMLATASDQRLGDLAAGTLVIREVDAPAPPAAAAHPPPEWSRSLDLTSLTDADRRLIRSFLARRSELDVQSRDRLVRTVADRLRQRLHGLPDGLADGEVVEGIARRLHTG